MKRSLPTPALRFFRGQARILVPCFVEELVRAVGPVAPSQRGDRIKDVAKPEFLRFSVFDVSRCTIPTNSPSVLIEHRVVADQEPAIFAIPAKHSLFILKGNATGECSVSLFSEPLDIFRMERAFPKIAGPHFLDR